MFPAPVPSRRFRPFRWMVWTPDVRAAIENARDEAVAESKSGQASGRFGMVLEAQTLYAPAALAFERAIRLDPKEFAWRYYLAIAQEYSAQPEQALAAVSDALRIRPDYTPAVLKRGALLLKLGRFQESDAVLEPLLAQNPNSAETLYTLGRVKFAQGDFTAAEDLYRRACAGVPNLRRRMVRPGGSRKETGARRRVGEKLPAGGELQRPKPAVRRRAAPRNPEAGHRH